MKRDFDLIRKILLAVEALPSPEGMQYPELMEKIPGYDFQFMAYQIGLAQQAGLIDAESYGFPVAGGMIMSLTPEGHDFLDSARSDTVWNKSKTKLAEVGGSASLEIFKAVLDQSMKSLLGLS